jgi:amino acid transporter
MTNLILTLIVCSTVITSIVNVAKPAYKKFAGKYAISITTALSFLLGILSAFSLAGYLGLELNTWLLIMLWLALGTGSNIFYDCRELIKWLWTRLNEVKKAVEEK